MQLNDYLRVFGGSFFFALATLLPFLNPPRSPRSSCR